MSRRAKPRKTVDEDRDRSGQLRPGRVKSLPSSSPRITGTARNLLRLARLVARTSKAGGQRRGASLYLPSTPKTSAFQRRAIVNVRYSNSRTPGGWKAHGTYIERESAKVNRENQDTERLGLAKEQSLGSLAESWQKAGDSVCSKSFSRRRTAAQTLTERHRISSLGSRAKYAERSNGAEWSTAIPTIRTSTSLCATGSVPVWSLLCRAS